MAKRAAAGAIIRCVSLDDEIEAPPTDQIPILLGNNRHGSNRAMPIDILLKVASCSAE